MPARKRSNSVVRVRKDRPDESPEEVRITKFRNVRQAEKSPFQRTPARNIVDSSVVSENTQPISREHDDVQQTMVRSGKRLSRTVDEIDLDLEPAPQHHKQIHKTRRRRKKLTEPLNLEASEQNPAPLTETSPLDLPVQNALAAIARPRMISQKRQRTPSELRAAMNDIVYLNAEISRLSQKKNTHFTTLRSYTGESIVTVKDSSGFDHVHCIPMDVISQVNFGNAHNFKTDTDMLHLLACHIVGIHPRTISATIFQEAASNTDTMFAAACYITKWATFYPDDFTNTGVRDDLMKLIGARVSVPGLDYDLFASCLANVVKWVHAGDRLFSSIKPAFVEEGEDIVEEIESLDTELICYAFMYRDLTLLSEVTIADWSDLIITDTVAPSIERVIKRQRDETTYFKHLLRHHRFCRDLMDKARDKNNLWLWYSLTRALNKRDDLIPGEGESVDRYNEFLEQNSTTVLPCVEPFVAWLRLAGGVIRARDKDAPLDGLQLETIWETLRVMSSHWCKSVRFAEKGVTRKLCEFIECDMDDKLR